MARDGLDENSQNRGYDSQQRFVATAVRKVPRLDQVRKADCFLGVAWNLRVAVRLEDAKLFGFLSLVVSLSYWRKKFFEFPDACITKMSSSAITQDLTGKCSPCFDSTTFCWNTKSERSCVCEVMAGELSDSCEVSSFLRLARWERSSIWDIVAWELLFDMASTLPDNPIIWDRRRKNLSSCFGNPPVLP